MPKGSARKWRRSEGGSQRTSGRKRGSRKDCMGTSTIPTPHCLCRKSHPAASVSLAAVVRARKPTVWTFFGVRKTGAVVREGCAETYSPRSERRSRQTLAGRAAPAMRTASLERGYDLGIVWMWHCFRTTPLSSPSVSRCSVIPVTGSPLAISQKAQGIPRYRSKSPW